jgi:glycosyltransferase involved in cell wall biosynthesis
LKKIKILILINRLAPDGAPTMILSLLRNMDKNTYDFTVCAFKKEVDDLEVAYNKAGIKTVFLNGRFNPISLVKLYSLFKNEKYDILHTFLAFSNITGRVLGRISGIPKIISSMENVIDILKLPSRIFEQLTMKISDVVLCISETVKKSFFKDVNNKIKVITIYNCVDVHYIDNIIKNANKEEIRKDLRVDDSYIICNVARLEPAKDQTTLIRAFDIFSQRIPNAYLLIIGWGKLDRKLKEYAYRLECRHKILFLGKRNDVIKLLSAIDLFILSSKIEGLSGALLEAMAARKPVIVSDIPQNLEVVIDGKTGVVFKCGDPVSLTNAILKIYNNPDYARILIENGRKRLDEIFSLDIMILKYENIYKELYSGKL